MSDKEPKGPLCSDFELPKATECGPTGPRQITDIKMKIINEKTGEVQVMVNDDGKWRGATWRKEKGTIEFSF